MNYFHFEEAVDVNGVTMSRIVNDVHRQVPGTESVTIRRGSHGGLVERPELLDPKTNLWLYRTARIYGETTIEGNCVIRNGTVRDCSIHGNVVVGSTANRMMRGQHETVVHIEDRVHVSSCRIDSMGFDELSNTHRNSESSVIYILDRSFIRDSELLGNTICEGGSHILSCCIDESRVSEHAFLTESTLLDHCRISGSASIDHTTAWGSTVLDEAIVSRCQLWYMTLNGNSSMVDNVSAGNRWFIS